MKHYYYVSQREWARVCGIAILQGWIRNPLSMEFLVSQISDDGIQGMGFLKGQKCTLCPDMGILTWRGDAIPLANEYGQLLVNKVRVL